MTTALLVSIISMSVIYAVTVLYAAIGEIFSQRAGIMNLGLEGIMLMGAVTGYMVAVYRQNLDVFKAKYKDALLVLILSRGQVTLISKHFILI